MSIPALCNVTDPFGNAMDLAVIKDISRGGVALELFPNSVSEVVSVCLSCADRRNLQINGRVAHQQLTPTGKMKLGLSLVGDRNEIRLFIAKAAESFRLNLMRSAETESPRNCKPAIPDAPGSATLIPVGRSTADEASAF